MRAAVAGGNAVGVALEKLFGAFRPGEAHFDAHAVLLFEYERLLVNWHGVLFRHDLFQEGEDAVFVMKDFLAAIHFVVPDDLEPLVNVAGDFKSLANDIGVEFGTREDLRIRLEADGCSRAAGRAEFLQLPLALPWRNSISHSAPSHLMVATNRFDSALTTDALTPCRPPLVL